MAENNQIKKTKEQWDKLLKGAAIDDFDLWCEEFISTRSKRHDTPQPLCTNREYCEKYINVDPREHYNKVRSNLIDGIKKGYVMGTCETHKYYPLRVDEHDNIIRVCPKCKH